MKQMKRLNYGHIKRALNVLFSNVELIVSPTRGIVAIFKNDNSESDNRVRIVLTEAEHDQHIQGIHLSRLESKKDLEHALDNAIESALKDRFHTIWVHRLVEYTKERREHKLNSLNQWIKAMQKRVDSNHSLLKLQTDINKTLEGMSGEQIEAVLMLVVAASKRGHGESREYWSKSYHEMRAELEAKLAVAQAGA